MPDRPELLAANESSKQSSRQYGHEQYRQQLMSQHKEGIKYNTENDEKEDSYFEAESQRFMSFS